jgi:D-arabinose 1-dehydrogenase-like Zn-dependent alcohol dehydrogenase
VWRVGDRVGIGWHGGHCLACDACRAGDFLRCPDRLGCGSSFDGGFAESVVTDWTALARIPNALDDVAAAPLMCAGITVFNALRASGASWGDTVAVHGLGGLGHLAVQFADKMGFRTVAISRGRTKRRLAHELGADEYIDAARTDPGEALRALGGARAIVTTAPEAAPMRPLFAGLGGRGRLVVVGVADGQLGAAASEYITRERGIIGSVIGTPRELERCLDFAARKGVRAWTQTFALDDIATAVARLHAGKLRFRAVILPT